MAKTDNRTPLINLIDRIATGVALVAAVFSLIIAALLLVNYAQMNRVDPSRNSELKQLQQKLKKNPQDSILREGIREMDLIARGAFFSTQNKLLIGRILLFSGILVLLVSGNISLIIRWKFPLPEKCPGMDNPYTNAVIARRVVFVGVCIVGMVVVLLGLNSNSVLDEDALTNDSPINKPEIKLPKGKINIPSQEALAENWPCFRDGNAFTERPDVPVHWDGKTGQNIIWKTDVAKPGFNSPIVWGNKLFLSGGDAGSRRVFLYNADDGKLIWQREVCGIPGSPSVLPAVSEDTGYAAASMATDGAQVYAIFANGDLICYNFNGDVIWSKNLGVPENHYGHSSSLMIDDGILVVQYDHGKSTALIGMKPDTGNIIWKTKHGEDISWASPVIVDYKGKKIILSATSTLVTGHDLKTGKELWIVECMAGEVATSPAYANGVVYVSNDNATTVAIEVEFGEIIWQNDELDMPDVASPLVKGKYLLLATSTGLLICVDAKTGEKLWDKECSTGFYSSPILVGDNVYVTDLQGLTYIFKLGDKYQEIAKNTIKDQVVTTPAFVCNRIFLRGKKFLYCIEKK